MGLSGGTHLHSEMPRNLKICKTIKHINVLLLQVWISWFFPKTNHSVLEKRRLGNPRNYVKQCHQLVMN